MKFFVFLFMIKIVVGFPATQVLVDNEKWALIPKVDGVLRLVAIEDAKAEFRSHIDVEPLVVKFEIFTQLNPVDGQPLEINNPKTLNESNFNPLHPTRFIIHGWQSDGSSSINTLIRNALLKRRHYNVIVVDWGSAAKNANYAVSRYKIDEVADQVAEFVDFLYKNGAMRLNSLSLIGHSLGAHVCGLTGKKLKSGKIGIIIGLDPAEPLFAYNNTNERLSHDDAKYVETIHTNAALLGFHKPIGQSSFYPNWGIEQPGCGFDPMGVCSHARAYEYYAESIETDKGFVSVACDSFENLLNENCFGKESKIKMGGEPSNSIKPEGIYYLPTNSEQPYAVGDVI